MQGYLDSVIQNSLALKSSLTRGSDLVTAGGSGELSTLFKADYVGSSGSSLASTNPAEVTQKNAEISTLKSQVTEKDQMIQDLEEKMTEILSKYREAENRASELQQQVDGFTQHAQGTTQVESQVIEKIVTTQDPELLIKLEEITKERDLLSAKLKEYEFIENDLAEIPRLNRTIEMLKQTLKQMGVDPDAPAGEVAVAEMPATEVDNSEEEMRLAMGGGGSEAVASTVDAAMASAASAETVAAAEPAPTKNPDDDLLQQFEKMLG
jgi:hypothetical protein